MNVELQNGHGAIIESTVCLFKFVVDSHFPLLGFCNLISLPLGRSDRRSRCRPLMNVRLSCIALSAGKPDMPTKPRWQIEFHTAARSAALRGALLPDVRSARAVAVDPNDRTVSRRCKRETRLYYGLRARLALKGRAQPDKPLSVRTGDP